MGGTGMLPRPPSSVLMRVAVSRLDLVWSTGARRSAAFFGDGPRPTGEEEEDMLRPMNEDVGVVEPAGGAWGW